MDILYLKHLIATSPLAGPATRLRRLAASPRVLRHPELGLLHQEDAMMDAVLAARLRRDSCCLDVGAHIGSMSHLFRTLAPEGRHALIEASPRKAAWLARRFPEATVHAVAVSDASGEEISFFENVDAPGYSSLTPRSSRGTVREIRVPCKRIDDLVPEDRRVDLIKIDVEGHEPAALRGAAHTIERNRPVILFEAGAAGDADFADDPGAEVFRLLTEEMGYAVRPVFGEHFGRGPLSLDAFLACRTYPFLAFNYVASPR